MHEVGAEHEHGVLGIAGRGHRVPGNGAGRFESGWTRADTGRTFEILRGARKSRME